MLLRQCSDGTILLIAEARVTNFEDFADIREIRQGDFEYIQAFCNSKRIHQTLGYKTPNHVEEIQDTKLLT